MINNNVFGIIQLVAYLKTYEIIASYKEFQNTFGEEITIRNINNECTSLDITEKNDNEKTKTL